MLYLMLLDILLSFPGSIHFIYSSFLGFLSYLNAIGTVLCVDTMKLLHMPARRINLAAQIHTHGKFDFWADWPDTLTQ